MYLRIAFAAVIMMRAFCITCVARMSMTDAMEHNCGNRKADDESHQNRKIELGPKPHHRTPFLRWCLVGSSTALSVCAVIIACTPEECVAVNAVKDAIVPPLPVGAQRS